MLDRLFPSVNFDRLPARSSDEWARPDRLRLLQGGTMTIYTWGYGRHTLAELIELRHRLGAVVIDTRYSPRSRRSEFNRKRLELALGDDYAWFVEFGNVNYKTTVNGPVVLNEPSDGRLKTIVTSERPPLLICQCPTRSCHRVDVAEFVSRETGWTIEHCM